MLACSVLLVNSKHKDGIVVGSAGVPGIAIHEKLSHPLRHIKLHSNPSNGLYVKTPKCQPQSDTLGKSEDSLHPLGITNVCAAIK